MTWIEFKTFIDTKLRDHDEVGLIEFSADDVEDLIITPVQRGGKEWYAIEDQAHSDN